MNYQRNPMRYPGVVNCGQSITEPQYGRRPMNNDRAWEGERITENGGANEKNGCLYGNSLAMVYSPCQDFEELYDNDEGLRRGTIFRELDKPFVGRRGV